MSYQRLLWHSGLTYRCVCPNCRQYTVYTDYNLGFRAWFPDGFVYCATCRRPVRHNENNAIKEDGTPYFPFPIRTPPPPGYVAYPIEYLALNPQYVPQQNGQQPQAQPNPQPYAQQPYPQQPQAQPYRQPVQPQASQPVEPQPVEPVDTAPAEIRKCPQCGHETSNSEAVFCTACGAKLEP